MKKIFSIVLIITFIGLIAFVGFKIFKSNSVASIELVGNVQTVYFANSTSEVNFNDAELKVTYQDGSIKLKKLTKNLVTVKYFSTSVVNHGTMKLIYKSNSIDIAYSIIWTGLYYMEQQTDYNYVGSVTTTPSEHYVAGVDNLNHDNTTAKEMIYFYNNGSCDYYTRTSSSSDWYLDDGYFDKTYNYTIKGDTIHVNLGSNESYDIVVKYTNDGELNLMSTKESYISSGETKVLTSKTEKKFSHYEMKGNRTFTYENISVYSPTGTIKFKKDSTFEESTQKIYVIVNYVNDNFLSKVYVKFKKSMFRSNGEFDTSTVQTTYGFCYYNGVRFTLDYTVYA